MNEDMLTSTGYEECGLTREEVDLRVSRGLTNSNTDVRTKSVARILGEHACTLFNAVNLAMALLVLSTGSYKNVAFVAVVVSNLVIGVTQEIRAKRMVDKLSIMTAKEVRVMRAGEVRGISVEDVVLDDMVLVSHGDQIPADGEVVSGEALVNESLLTGESDAIEKASGSQVFSGSFVETGSVRYRVTKVGQDGFAAKINAEAKYVKPVSSEIVDTLDFIIKLGTFALVPLGIGLFARLMLSSRFGHDAAILQTVAAVIGMIPQGLVLLTSSVFAIATTRLAARKVLVQQAYCVESLARVDVLCLDKTGTITTGAMEVSEARGEGAASAAYTIARALEADANETSRAIISFGEGRGLVAQAAVRTVPFSSATKLSGCLTVDGRALAMGAAQFVLARDYSAHEEEVRSFGQLSRVLAVCEFDGFDDGGRPLGRARLIGYLAIQDEIRPTARATMEFFKRQGVDIRVISGDDPYTVSGIARAVGVPGAQRFVDASTLSDEREVARAVEECRVFGRVTPQMKRSLLRALKAQGHVVAMTGDGVNDVLALKEADCSVAMAAGSAAARNVAEIVLADNDFAHMPEVVAEGRRSINNLERSAALFLMKTVYTMVLALICIALPPYPFIPVQMSLVSTAVIGVPSFLLALEPNHDRVRGSFIRNVLSRSLPASGAVIASLFLTILVARILGWSVSELSTCCMLEMFAIGTALIYRMSLPPNPFRLFVLAVVVAIAVLGCTVFSSFFSVGAPTLISVGVALALSVSGIFLFVRTFAAVQEGRGTAHAIDRIIARVESLNAGK